MLTDEVLNKHVQSQACSVTGVDACLDDLLLT